MPLCIVRPRPRRKKTVPLAKALLSINDLPPQVREVAMLRGLGLSANRIGEVLTLPRSRVVKLLTLYRRPFKSLRLIMGERKLSSRAVNSLGLCGIHSPEDAFARGVDGVMQSLLNLPNCGVSTRDEVRRWMEYYADQAAESSLTMRASEAGSDNGAESARVQSERAVELESPVRALSHTYTHLPGLPRQAHLESELEYHNARRAPSLR
jgi:hypothetical protein